MNINIFQSCSIFFHRTHEEKEFILPLKVEYLTLNMIVRSSINVVIIFFWYRIIVLSGPKPKTIADFWIMIWQEEVCNIVCLTNLKEGAKVRHTFEQYDAKNISKKANILNSYIQSDFLFTCAWKKYYYYSPETFNWIQLHWRQKNGIFIWNWANTVNTKKGFCRGLAMQTSLFDKATLCFDVTNAFNF